MIKQRSRLVIIILSISLFFFWLRLAYWQVWQTKFLKSLFTRQSFQTKNLPVPRGQIITQDGQVLAGNRPAWRLGFNPKNCQESVDGIITKYYQYQQSRLQPIMTTIRQNQNDPLFMAKFNPDKLKTATDSAYWQTKVDNLITRAKKTQTKWIELKVVTDDYLKMLNQSELSCLVKSPTFKRSYTDAQVDGYFLGFVGKDKDGQDVGYFGLEGFYNQELTGSPGQFIGQYDALGKPLPQRFKFKQVPLPGRDLYLHLNYNMQHLAQEAIKNGVIKYQAKQGSIIILNPQNMGILAMASYPSYIPENYTLYQQTTFANPVTNQLYEPGSTFKIIIMALGLETQAVTPDTKCSRCAGPLTAYGTTIRTWNDKYFPNSTMTDIIVHSDNVGMTFVASQIGKDQLYTFLGKAGFGQKTGIDLQDDQTIPLKPLSQWYPIDTLTAGFGQGISLTPIKLAQLVASLARGGEMISPRLVDYIKDNQNRQFEVTAKDKTRLFSNQTSRLVTQMMVKVVKEGSVKWTNNLNFEVAGKTGTAQVVVDGQYDPQKTIASFVGFWPIEKPEILILVKLDFPQTSPWGSETAAPIFFELANKINLIRLNQPNKQ